MSNWVELEIKGKKYFLLCKISEENEFDALLYDGSASWHEKQTLETIVLRVKEQNKRINYDEATIKRTLQSAQPTEAFWLQEDSEVSQDFSKCNLQLRYQVQSCAFHFIWYFTRQTEYEFQKFILLPLFRIVQGLTQQNNELREIVRKKDIEIKQFKYEGAVLKRVTVSTQPFDFIKFDEKYAETLELSKCMNQISDLLKAQYSEMKMPVNAKNGDELVESNKKKDLKLTPRRKRRKLIEAQQRVIVEKLRARNKPFAYESSQSQLSSISQSDTEAPSTSKRLFRSPRKSQELKIENDLNETISKRNSTQKPDQAQSPVKLTKRNLNVGIEYDDSSEEEGEKVIERKRSPTERISEIEKNSPPVTRSSKSPVKSPKSSPGTRSSTLARIIGKNDGIEYEDSSESSTEDRHVNKSSTTLEVTQKKDLTSKNTQSPEQLSNDVQSLIDEWKALEKRRLADLKIRQ